MAAKHKATTTDPAAGYTGRDDELVPSADDSGGSHAKGYSADLGPEIPVPEEGPIPLVETADLPPVQVPDQESGLPATGRKEPGTYTPNDRLMGSDR